MEGREGLADSEPKISEFIATGAYPDARGQPCLGWRLPDSEPGWSADRTRRAVASDTRAGVYRSIRHPFRRIRRRSHELSRDMARTQWWRGAPSRRRWL